MLKTLPFNALRTLEAVVRLKGFGRAAEELGVTQSAVSQHVRLLEDWLGQKLLVRKGRMSEPTAAGTELSRAILDGFGGISEVCDRLRGLKGRPARGVLVASPPGFAFIWLLPRLLEFDGSHPDTPVSLSTDPASRDHAMGEADVYISYGTGGFPDLHAEKLMDEQMTPVCTPAIAAQLSGPGDLARHIVLRDTLDDSRQGSTWEFWAREVGIPLPHLPRSRTFGQANLVIQAAIQGYGIAMGRTPLVADALAQGQLVRPFPWSAHSQNAYWLVCRHDALEIPDVQAFRTWLHGAAARIAPLVPPDGGQRQANSR